MKIKARTYPIIILLSGTPGTGKTTISKLLSLQNGWRIFSLGDFIVKKKLFTTEKDERDTKIIDTETAAKEAAQEIVSHFLNSQVIVVDSHYADILLDGFKDLKDETTHNCIFDYARGLNIVGLVCRCHPKILQTRLMNRDYSSSKVIENVQAEILSESTQNLMEVFQKDHIYEIDTTTHPVNEISESIIQCILQKKEGRNIRNSLLKRVGEIDWIVTLNEEGTLNSYFKEDYGERFDIDLKDVEEES
jgi:adenylate kinase